MFTYHQFLDIFLVPCFQDEDFSDDDLDISADATFIVGHRMVKYPIHGTDRWYIFTPKFHVSIVYYIAVCTLYVR